MSSFLRIFLFCAAAAIPVPCSAAAETEKRRPPNILFILADDLGWRDLACYGHGIHETPHIDKLAADGMRFTDGYAACQVCSPTRASIMAGKYPSRTGITNWLPGDNYKGTPLLCERTAQFMTLEEFTVAEALKAGGYQTAFVGKWHLGKEPYYPQHQGFDVNVAGSHWGHPHKGSLYDGGIRVPWIVQWPGVTKPGSVCDHPVISTDFYPTLLEMTGQELRPDQHCDGVSLVPLLKGAADFDRGPIIWFYPHYLPRHHAEPGSAIRIGDWKFIQFYEKDRRELYNLKGDIGEADNLAIRMPERATEMKAQLDAALKKHRARIPAPDPAYQKK